METNNTFNQNTSSSAAANQSVSVRATEKYAPYVETMEQLKNINLKIGQLFSIDHSHKDDMEDYKEYVEIQEHISVALSMVGDLYGKQISNYIFFDGVEGL